MRSSLPFAFGALILSFAASAAARPDLNSFLNRKATTTFGLVSQIQSDPQVADRYQRHFSMSKSEVVRYVGGLHREPLAKGGYYTVYSVPKGGELRMHVQKLKAGEPMFADAAGHPTLIVRCGNPVTMGPSRSKANPVVLTPTDDSSTRVVLVDTPDSVALDAPGELVALAPPVPDIPPTPPIVTPPPVIEPLPPTVPASAVGGGSRFPWIAGLPLLIPLFGSHGGNGGGGGPSVPEPASMAVLGVGLAAVARRRRKG